MNKIIDFINIQQSNSIKAIIMLLIVLGHNHILAPNNESSHLFGYLYRFHVSIFFILPFFYNRYDCLCKEAINKIIVRNSIPYVLFFLLCYLLYHFIIIKDGFNLDFVPQKVKKVKFSSIIKPDEKVTLYLKKSETSIDYKFTKGDKIFSSGTFVL